MKVPVAKPVTTPPKRFVPPFENGDRLDQKTFHDLYERTPFRFRAELVDGIVYLKIPKPVRLRRRPRLSLSVWLGAYEAETEGVQIAMHATNILIDRNETHPYQTVIVDPALGGRTSINADDFVEGGAELLVEIAERSCSLPYHKKFEQYQKANVREYIIVNLESRNFNWFTNTANGFQPIKPNADGIMKSRVLPGLWLDREATLNDNNKRVRAVLDSGLASPEHAKFVTKLQRKLKRKS
jgi:hypothetical protein